MNKPAYAMDQKNPVMMDHAMKVKDLSGDKKITQKDVLIGRGVIDPPTKMYGSKPTKMYGSKPAKMGHSPKKMYGKKK